MDGDDTVARFNEVASYAVNRLIRLVFCPYNGDGARFREQGA